jgi:hypothetical protein
MNGASSLLPDLLAFDCRSADKSNVAVSNPGRELANSFERVRLMRLKDQTNTLYGRGYHPTDAGNPPLNLALGVFGTAAMVTASTT